jgi:peptide/nickel transport system permease protein
MSATTIPKISSNISTATWWNSRVMRRFRRNGLAITGLAMVLAFMLVALFAPLIAPPQGNCLRDLGGERNVSSYLRATFAPPATCYTINRYSFSEIPTAPDSKAIMGTVQGYDLFYGMVWGTRTAFLLSIVVVLGNLMIGVTLGAVAGYFGGWIDNLLMRFTDMIFAFPGLILTMTLVSMLGRSIWIIALSFIVVGWAGYARLLRGSILKTRALEFVDGARALGVSDSRIILRHVLPNSLTSLSTQVVLDMGSVVLGAAALSFLGLGLEIGYADWGQLMSFARNFVQQIDYWYVWFFPGFVIVLWGLAWNLLGDALRDALDPREK